MEQSFQDAWILFPMSQSHQACSRKVNLANRIQVLAHLDFCRVHLFFSPADSEQVSANLAFRGSARLPSSASQFQEEFLQPAKVDFRCQFVDF